MVHWTRLETLRRLHYTVRVLLFCLLPSSQDSLFPTNFEKLHRLWFSSHTISVGDDVEVAFIFYGNRLTKLSGQRWSLTDAVWILLSPPGTEDDSGILQYKSLQEKPKSVSLTITFFLWRTPSRFPVSFET